MALAIGWIFGFVASVLGLLGSVTLDMPAAPSILVTLTAMLLVWGVVVAIWKRGRGETGAMHEPVSHEKMRA
jgi:ABC-type Mn2+/Zn2+ transport system permease subunit